MLYHNQFNIEPGVFNFFGKMVTILTIVTHKWVDGKYEELEKPLVVYRDLEYSTEKWVGYQCDLEYFKKFAQPL